MEENRIYEYTNRGKLKIKDLVWYIIIAFPLTSILKVHVGPLNIMLTSLLFVLFFYIYLKTDIFKKKLLLCLYAVLGVIMNMITSRLHFYNTNMVFYFPFLILYFIFFMYYQDDCMEFMKKNKKYIDIVTGLWLLTILISLLLTNFYVFEGETRGFVSFAGTTFLLCQIAIFVFAILAIQYNLWHRKFYLISMFIPSLCILLGTTRTYLGVLACAWMLFLYTQIENKRMYFVVLVIAAVILIGIVLLSPIKDKFINTAGRTEIGLDPLEAFTSGRSEFWVYDLQTMLKNEPIKILFGNGVNYLFNLNYARFQAALWAHNDFLQIFSDYGLLGLFIYIGMFKAMFKRTFKGLKVSKLAMLMLIIIWVFNAFFNMFYTYFNAVLSYPFYCIILKMDAIRYED